MTPWLLALWVAASGSAEAALHDDRVAINPNLPFSACDGGASAITIGQRMQPATLRGVFVGQLRPEQVLDGADVSWCPGHYPPHAQACLIVRDAGEYSIQVTDSQGVDTVLAVEIQPSIFYCDDDSGGDLRPLVNSWLEPGQYRVYVGSYSQGASGSFVLSAGPWTY